MKRIVSIACLTLIGACADDAPQATFQHGTDGHMSMSHHGASAAAPSGAIPHGSQRSVDVRPDGAVRTLARALELAAPGARITVHEGTYHESGLLVAKPVDIVGVGYPTIDGGGREILRVTADDVTVRGLRLANVATSFVNDAAAIKVTGASGCVIQDNRVDDAFFGIYLAEVTRCHVLGNVLRASKGTESLSGNGIHLWTSRDITIAGNTVTGHRDGIYFEFVHNTLVSGNVSQGNLRYGLHFMYSDECRYERNVFRRNGSGVAVMYTKHVAMVGNTFDGNRGGASYGLLLKEIADSRLEHNRFFGNTTGLLADGANRLIATGNDFTDNGWAVKLDASTLDASFTGNNFIGNTFDVATNSRQHTSSFSGNYWDDYRGYDLDADGTGDVPFHPVRLFSLVVAQHAPAIALLRSAFVSLLDAAERSLPSLTPETLVDVTPRMRPLS